MGKYNSGVLNALDERCKINYIFMQTIKKKCGSEDASGQPSIQAGGLKQEKETGHGFSESR